MENKTILTAIFCLILGLGIGYAAAPKSTCEMMRTPQTSSMSDMHKMPDGSMMANHGSAAPSMADMMHDMNAALEGKTGDEFDRAFLTEMIVHHEGAVVMAEAALRDAKHKEIKDLAGAIISAQNKEIADMKSWLKSWYNN